MKRNIKSLFLGSILLTGSIMPLTVVSADPVANSNNGSGNNNSNNNSNNNNANNNAGNNAGSNNNNANNTSDKPKKTEVDKDFDEFKDKLNDKIKEDLADLLEEKIKNLVENAESVLSDEKSTAQDTAQAIYFKKIAKYLETNKKQILKTPEKYGFTIIYPKILSSDKKYSKGTIEFDGDSFTNVDIGNTLSTDYSIITTGKYIEEPSKEYITEVVDKDIVNTLDYDELLKREGAYFEKLKEQLDDIVNNYNDVPMISGEDANSALIFEKEKNGDRIDLKVPTGYEDWNEYIISKITNRFLKFDLLANQQANEDEEEKPQDTPPILPKEETPPPPPKILDEGENIANTSPILSYVSYDSVDLNNTESMQKFIEKFKSDKNQVNFFFENPINTQFTYKVNNLELENNKIMATVELEDQIRNKAGVEYKRVYKKEITKLKSKDFTRSYEAGLNLLTKTYLIFYNALGIGEKANLKELRNKYLESTVFNMIYAAVKLDNEQKFKDELNAIVAKYQKSLNDNTNINTLTYQNSAYARELIDFFVRSLNESKILEKPKNEKEMTIGVPYFGYLANAYNNLYISYVRQIQEKENKQFIQKNLKLVKTLNKDKTKTFSFKKVDEAIKVLKDNIDYLRGISNTEYVDIYNQYLTYNEVLSDIVKTFTNLSVITQARDLDTAKVQDYVKAYDSLITKAYRSKKDKNLIYYVFSGILFALAGLLSLISLLLLTIKKKWKIKNTKNKIILTSMTALIAVVVAIVIFVIGGI